jgi:hypothetical protein
MSFGLRTFNSKWSHCLLAKMRRWYLNCPWWTMWWWQSQKSRWLWWYLPELIGLFMYRWLSYRLLFEIYLKSIRVQLRRKNLRHQQVQILIDSRSFSSQFHINWLGQSPDFQFFRVTYRSKFKKCSVRYSIQRNHHWARILGDSWKHDCRI